MKKKCATGYSSHSVTEDAADEACSRALSALNATPRLCILFCSVKHNLNVVLRAARKRVNCKVIGCTTAGEFTENGLTRGGLAIMLIAADEGTFLVSQTTGLSSNPAAAAQRSTRNFQEASAAAKSRGLAHSTTMVLIDGLCGTGPEFVQEVRRGTTPFQQIVGGAAGDDAAFNKTFVGTSEKVEDDSAVVVHSFEKSRWGIGVGHGLQAASRKMTVTRAEGNTVFEIDRRPAFEAYIEHAKQNATELAPENTGSYMIQHEIGVLRYGDIHHARAPLSVGADHSITCAAGLSAGDTICILDGRLESMVQASKDAAQLALDALGDNDVAGVLVFDCVCRGLILADDFQQEVDAIASVFGNVPVCGFLTYGEVARHKGNLSGWHNTCAVVVAIAA